MFKRKCIDNLAGWKNNAERRPLVLRGARQTGKTTVVRQFAASFSNYVELNLEKEAHKKIFAEVKDAQSLIRGIEVVTKKIIVPGQTLLFIDEIQNSISAIQCLRFLYEEMPLLHVIAAGSSLEVRMRREGWSFPVGRVEFLYLYPVSFEEFLVARGMSAALGVLKNAHVRADIPIVAHEELLNVLSDYLIVGGMPAAVACYLKTQSYDRVRKIQQDIHASFHEDFVKYAKESETYFLKLLWDKIPFEVGRRVKYSQLSDHPAKAKNVVNAFDILHSAMLAERVFPTTDCQLPLAKKEKAAPKVFLLDVGLCTQALDLTKDQIHQQLIKNTIVGGIRESLVFQELLALDDQKRNQFFFWIRDDKDTLAETDFLFPHKQGLFPLEVKAGKSGTLKSLHQYLFHSKGKIGVRFYGGELEVQSTSVVMQNNETLSYQLLSVPLYLIFRLPELMDNSVDSQ